MALVGHISGSLQSNSVIGISGSVIIANEPSSRFPQLPGSDITFFVSGSKDGTGAASFGGDVVVSGSSKHLSNVQITGSLLLDGSLVDLQATNVNLSTAKPGTINIGATGNANDVIVAGDGKIQLLSDIGGSPSNNPPAGSIQILAGGVGGVGFNPAGGEIVIESTNGFTVNTNGDMTLQMNSAANETLNIFASNAFSSTPNIQVRSDGNNASNSIDITSHNGGGISIGSNSSYDTGDILIGQKEYQRTIRIGNVSTVNQYVIIGSEYGSSYTAVSGSLIVTGDMTVNGTTTTINTANTEIRDSLLGLGYASGSIAESNGDRGIIGGLATGDDVAMFWDNSASEFAVARTDSTPGSSSVNITSYANMHVNVLSGSALTGSLTKLSDGSDYLRAGANISLATGSLGQVTIDVTGLSGYVVGPASATNDAIAVYDGTTGKLIKNSNLLIGTRTSTQAVVTASVNLADYGLALIPNGTGSLMASAPDGTAVGGNTRGINSVDFQIYRENAYEVASGIKSVIGGGGKNVASGQYSFVGGGSTNRAEGNYAIVAGGQLNIATGDHSVIAGGYYNIIDSGVSYCVIGGGNDNQISGSFSTIAGGYNNAVTADYATVGGGRDNSSSGMDATIAGGFSNDAQGSWSTIGGGRNNEASSDKSTIAGGENNIASGINSTVAGGFGNTASGGNSTVGGGIYNVGSQAGATVAGGEGNLGSGQWSAIGGGIYNTASLDYATVGGGYTNFAGGQYSTIAGGNTNYATTTHSTIGGGSNNSATSGYTTIAGGSGNIASAQYSSVGGGNSNVADDEYSTIGGGRDNLASGQYSTVAGGRDNETQSQYSTIGGGNENTVPGDFATVSGGRINYASGTFSAIGGGEYNSTYATHATVGGGWYNMASGTYSTVIGGLHNQAYSYGETVAGVYATIGGGDALSYVSTDRLFVVGNGTGTGASERSNALTLLKNGNLHLSGTLTLMSGSTSGITFPTTRGTNGQVLTSDGAGLITWQTSVSQPSYFTSTTAGSIYTTGSAAFIGNEAGIDAPSDKGSDVSFYVSGSTDGSSIALFGGGIVTSGSLSVFGNTTLGNVTSDLITFNARAGTDFLPANDNQYNLGSATNRWANVYTGDLHLRNDRGDWTVIEEDEYLSIRNNKTGKMFKFVLEPV